MTENTEASAAHTEMLKDAFRKLEEIAETILHASRVEGNAIASVTARELSRDVRYLAEKAEEMSDWT